MKFIIKNFLILLIVLMCLVLCGCSELESLYDGLQSETKEYEHGTSIVTNSLGETYTIEYTESFGFPSQSMTIQIYQTDELIIEYSSKYEQRFIPNQVVHLFKDDEINYYYVAANYNFLDPLYKESVDYLGDFIVLHSDKNYNKTRITLDITDESNKSLSKILRDNIERTDLIKKFDECGFNSKNIIDVYDIEI